MDDKITFHKPFKLDPRYFTSCQYCKTDIPKTDYYLHIETEHGDRYIKIIKRLKIGLVVSLSFVTISIGIVIGLLI